ncbi:hypothetical protein WJX82_001827 [Trebouxia sp. C0006]
MLVAPWTLLPGGVSMRQKRGRYLLVASMQLEGTKCLRPTLTKNVWIDSFPTNKHGMAWHGMTYYGADKSLVSRYNSLLFRIKFAVGGAERLLKLTGALNVNCTGGLLSH